MHAAPTTTPALGAGPNHATTTPKPLGPGRAFVCFAGLDWWYHNRAHSDFQLMLRLARERDVLLVNSLGMRMPLPGRSAKSLRRITRKLRSCLRGLRTPVPELPRFRVLTPFVLPLYGSAKGRRLAKWLVRAQILRALRRCGIARAHVVVTVPTALDVALDLPGRTSLVYNRSDKHSAFEESDGAVIRTLEQRLFAAADHVVYASRALLESERAQLGQRAVFLDHGVDLQRFRPRPEEELDPRIRAIPRPRIGWFGTLRSSVVDFALLGKLARALPEASIVLVGDATSELGAWAELPNVHRLGQCAHEEIPALGGGFDVALMPWLQNDWVQHANPIKLKEYLALGLPVVSMRFPEAERYADVIDVADDHPQFIDLVRSTLAGRARADAEARVQRVQGADWSLRAARLAELCDQAEENAR